MSKSVATAMLTAADDLFVANERQGDLDREYQLLSERYRSNRRTPRELSSAAIAAYAAARLPATLAVNIEVHDQLARCHGPWAPSSMLDIGAGLGAAAWAAAASWPSLTRLTLCEDSPAMADAGRRLAAAAPFEVVRDATWFPQAHVRGVEPADLVVASYVLGEVDSDVAAVTGEWWSATADTLVIVEPGTPAGYACVLGARSSLIDAGATIAAPCPHAGECPMTRSQGWCHFAVRLGRSRAHRALKHGALGSEDEKFSYVIATRQLDPPGTARRVVRRPARRGGHVRLELCTETGLEDAVIATSSNDYKRARKLRWGDQF